MESESLDIRCFTHEQRHALLDDLMAIFSNCGGWVLERNSISPNTVEFHIEIQLRSTLDLYAALLAAGIELTRTGHDVFTGLCARRKHLRIGTALGRIVTLRLEIAFLDDLTLNTLLRSGCSVV